MRVRFSLASLFAEFTLIALLVGLARQAAISWNTTSALTPAYVVSSFLIFGAAYANLRLMFGATDPPDLPPQQPTGPSP